MITKMSSLMVLALLGAAFGLTPGSAAAQSYSGNYSLKASLPPGFGDTGCLTLVDNGTVNGVHSGTATISGDLGGQGSGSFVIINSLLVINFDDGGEGVSSTGVVVAHATKGNLSTGFLENVYAGYAYPYGALSFGQKGSC